MCVTSVIEHKLLEDIWTIHIHNVNGDGSKTANPACPGQSPESCKMVVCVCVCVTVIKS